MPAGRPPRRSATWPFASTGRFRVAHPTRPVADTVALYDRIAASYERWWAPVIRPATLRLLDLIADRVADEPNATLLDIGAGTAPLARAAVARWPGVRVLAVDPSSGMLDVGRREAAASLPLSARRRISWLSGLAEELPLADASVDVALSSFTLQYLHNRLAAVREARRVSRPGAVIAAVTWIENGSVFIPWTVLDAVLDELRIRRTPSGAEQPIRSISSAATLLRRAGFREVHAVGGSVEYQWTLPRLVRCAVEAEQRALFESLATGLRERVLATWQERLAQLGGADLRYHDAVVYLSGRRPVNE
jgi:ubiquinone/menaquinone biosynthesis C-methylase UbiE